MNKQKHDEHARDSGLRAADCSLSYRITMKRQIIYKYRYIITTLAYAGIGILSYGIHLQSYPAGLGGILLTFINGILLQEIDES